MPSLVLSVQVTLQGIVEAFDAKVPANSPLAAGHIYGRAAAAVARAAEEMSEAIRRDHGADYAAAFSRSYAAAALNRSTVVLSEKSAIRGI
jgi:hypothetical protein